MRKVDGSKTALKVQQNSMEGYNNNNNNNNHNNNPGFVSQDPLGETISYL